MTTKPISIREQIRNIVGWALSREDVPATLWFFIPPTVIALVVVYVTAWPDGLRFVVAAMASVAGGGILGFLFGIPRTVQGDATTHTATRATQAHNTNLEQISDWLTKIIVGISLVQFNDIRAWFRGVAMKLAEGPPPTPLAFSGSIMTYFGITGFLFGYIYTQLYMPGARNRALRDLERQVQNSVDAVKEISQDLKEVSGRTTALADFTRNPQPFRRLVEGGAAPSTEDAAKIRELMDSDPHKGLFGGVSRRNGRELVGSVKPIPGFGDDMFHVHLEVRATDPAKPLTGDVKFFLHPTFDPSVVSVQAQAGVASLDRFAWGSFTVGVEADAGETRLELDLSELPDAPAVFKSR